MHPFHHHMYSLYGAKGLAWLEALPERIAALAAYWQLDQITPVPNLTYHYVASASQHGAPVILKIGYDAATLAQEARALASLQGHGAVTLLAETEGALLLQRAMPGTSLKTYLPERRQDALEIACNVAAALHQAPLPIYHFPHMNTWLQTVEKSWAIPVHHLENARKIRAALQHLHSPERLLHGDLHHDNIIAYHADWLAIDPKGVIGQPIHEYWAMIQVPEHDIPYIAERFHIDPGRLWQCYYLHLIKAACWNVEDNLDPSMFLGKASAISFKVM